MSNETGSVSGEDKKVQLNVKSGQIEDKGKIAIQQGNGQGQKQGNVSSNEQGTKTSPSGSRKQNEREKGKFDMKGHFHGGLSKESRQRFASIKYEDVQLDDDKDVAKTIANFTGSLFKPGDTYDPLELYKGNKAPAGTSQSDAVQRRFLRKKPKPRRLVQTGFEIHALNLWFLSNFLTPTGKIMSRRETGLPAKKQRKVAKAIKTARQMGLMPYLSNYKSEVVETRQLEPYDRSIKYADREPPVITRVEIE